MANDKLAFENIFEGNDIKPEVKDKITSILNDVVDRKVQSRLAEEEDKEDEEEKEEEVEEAHDESSEDKDDDEEEVEEAHDESSDEEDESEVEEAHDESSDEEDEDEDEDEVEEAHDESSEDEDEEQPEEENEEKSEEDDDDLNEGLSPEQIKERDKIAKKIYASLKGSKYTEKRRKEIAYSAATNMIEAAMQDEISEAEAEETVANIQKDVDDLFRDPHTIQLLKAEGVKPNDVKRAWASLLRATPKKASVTFELFKTMVQSMSKHIGQVKSDMANAKAAAEEEMQEQVSQHIDKYLTYVAEQWAEQNKLALENGIKVQLAESFLKKFDELYSQFNFKAVPERDMVFEMAQKVMEAENRLNEEVGKNAELLDKMNKQKKDNLINEATKGLTATQTEKFKKLVENVTFENASSFEQKLQTIKETAFTKEPLKGDTKIEEETAPSGPSNERISRYVDAISKNLKF